MKANDLIEILANLSPNADVLLNGDPDVTARVDHYLDGEDVLNIISTNRENDL